MSKPVKVYNKGTRPVVFKRDRTGTDAIHPGKFKTFDSKKGNGIIEKFKDACTEDDFKKHLAEVVKKIKLAEEEKKKADEAEAKEKETERKKEEAEAKKLEKSETEGK